MGESETPACPQPAAVDELCDPADAGVSASGAAARQTGDPDGAAFMPGDCAVWLGGLWVATAAVAAPVSGTDRTLCAGESGGSGDLQPTGACGRSDARVL